jgi:hypothetical protein
MAPDSLALEIVAGIATLATAVGLGVLWSYSNGRLRWLGRAMAVLACLAATAATGLVWVNRQIDEYPTWASMLGSTAEAATTTATTDGNIVSFTVQGRASHLTMPVYAYLPPGY